MMYIYVLDVDSASIFSGSQYMQ